MYESDCASESCSSRAIAFLEQDHAAIAHVTTQVRDCVSQHARDRFHQVKMARLEPRVGVAFADQDAIGFRRHANRRREDRQRHPGALAGGYGAHAGQRHQFVHHAVAHDERRIAPRRDHHIDAQQMPRGFRQHERHPARARNAEEALQQRFERAARRHVFGELGADVVKQVERLIGERDVILDDALQARRFVLLAAQARRPVVLQLQQPVDFVPPFGRRMPRLRERLQGQRRTHDERAARAPRKRRDAREQQHRRAGLQKRDHSRMCFGFAFDLGSQCVDGRHGIEPAAGHGARIGQRLDEAVERRTRCAALPPVRQ
jgi:hypothetical protein